VIMTPIPHHRLRPGDRAQRINCGRWKSSRKRPRQFRSGQRLPIARPIDRLLVAADGAWPSRVCTHHCGLALRMLPLQ
jgi:hypothetical protein